MHPSSCSCSFSCYPSTPGFRSLLRPLRLGPHHRPQCLAQTEGDPTATASVISKKFPSTTCRKKRQIAPRCDGPNDPNLFPPQLHLRPQHRGVHLVTEEILAGLPELAQFQVVYHDRKKRCFCWLFHQAEGSLLRLNARRTELK